MLKHLTKTTVSDTRGSLGLLALRLVAGVGMAMHGWGKIQTPMSWMGPDAPVPGFLQFLAAFSEFGGGIALTVGLLTPLASLGVAITMAVAVQFHMGRGDPFIGNGGPGYELAAIYLAIALSLLCTGAGKFSIDSKICK